MCVGGGGGGGGGGGRGGDTPDSNNVLALRFLDLRSLDDR